MLNRGWTCRTCNKTRVIAGAAEGEILFSGKWVFFPKSRPHFILLMLRLQGNSNHRLILSRHVTAQVPDNVSKCPSVSRAVLAPK